MLSVKVAAPGTGDGHGFHDRVSEHARQGLKRAPLSQLQINVGRLCNQACNHCHVEAGPKRTEIMELATMGEIIDWLADSPVRSVDITGGAPELNPNFRWLVEQCHALDCDIISRCNLTVLLEPGQEDLAAWYAGLGVTLVCSMPCYTEENVDAQRGKGVFDKSITALRILNAQGYGSRLPLDMVYNPGGAFLPPSQEKLERTYRAIFRKEHGIEFSRLLTLTNLPVNRFAHYLEREDRYDEYMTLLKDSFNPATLDGLMCRHLVSVDWRGYVYDCDFNQMLDIPLAGARRRRLAEIDPATLAGTGVAVDSHCFGCTAGSGSSCGGALT